MKKKNKQYDIMGMTKGYVGSGLMLGVGATALEGMGQGGLSKSIITPASNMMGPMISAGYGMGVLNLLNQESSKLEKHKRR